MARIMANLELCPECAVLIESGRIVSDAYVTDHHEFGRIDCDNCGGNWLGEYCDAVILGRD